VNWDFVWLNNPVNKVLKNKYRAVSQGARPFGMRSILASM
jgi:hypothetical protein